MGGFHSGENKKKHVGADRDSQSSRKGVQGARDSSLLESLLALDSPSWCSPDSSIFADDIDGQADMLIQKPRTAAAVKTKIQLFVNPRGCTKISPVPVTHVFTFMKTSSTAQQLAREQSWSATY